jgi:hypothetical protein
MVSSEAIDVDPPAGSPALAKTRGGIFSARTDARIWRRDGGGRMETLTAAMSTTWGTVEMKQGRRCDGPDSPAVLGRKPSRRYNPNYERS